MHARSGGALAGRKLAELDGVAASIPNQGILTNMLGLQAARPYEFGRSSRLGPL
jgi:hypothetical protein